MPTPVAAPLPARRDYSRWWVLGAAALLIAALFFIDLLIPLGVAVWLPYLGAVFLVLAVPGQWHVIATAAACSTATVLGFLADGMIRPPGMPMWTAVVNRALAIVTFWLAAVGGLYVRRLAALRQINEDLLREIEERRRAEGRIREQASLLDIAQDAICVRDLDDRITYWNRGAERMYGWTAAEVLGASAVGLVERGSAAERAAARESLLARGEWSGETLQTTKDGRTILAQTRWTLVRDDRGSPRAKLVVCTDVTERRRLEGQLFRTQRLESIGVLAGGIAHDFNNLLTPALMAAKFLRENRPEDERASLLGTLQTGLERGADLVQKLLSFAGGVEGPRVPIAVESVVAEIRAIISHTFPKSIRLEVQLADDLNPVLADATQLSQVLMNLCVNARDAMPQGGVLRIMAETVTIGSGEAVRLPDASPGDFVRLVVADTGSGISDAIIDRVFDPFFTTKGTGGGTGLGLSTVLGIIRSHGGFVTVTSQPDVETRFAVYWPTAPARPAAPARPVSPSRPANGEGSLVLVVDDEEPILTAARMALETDGFRVLTARDGREALAIYRERIGDVQSVILDAMMPDLDGAATFAALVELDPECRVVVTSGLRLSGALAEAAAAGRVAFLPKPFTAEQLRSALDLAPRLQTA